MTVTSSKKECLDKYEEGPRKGGHVVGEGTEEVEIT